MKISNKLSALAIGTVWAGGGIAMPDGNVSEVFSGSNLSIIIPLLGIAVGAAIAAAAILIKTSSTAQEGERRHVVW